MILVYKLSKEHNSTGIDPEDLESPEYKNSVAESPLYDLVRYLQRNLELSETITSVYLKEYESYGTEDRTISDFDLNAAQSTVIKSIIPKINLFTEKSWRKITSSSKKSRIIFVAERIEKTEAVELQKIPPGSLKILINNSEISDVKRLLEIIVGLPDIENAKKRNVVYGEDQNRINLFQSKLDIYLPKDQGFVIHLNTDDELLSEFLILDLLGNKKIFFHSAKESLDGLKQVGSLKDAYDALVVNEFNSISYQKQNDLWLVIEGLGFDKKKVIFCGKNSKIIPSIRYTEKYFSTEYFNFKNIKNGFIKFLCYYYQKRGSYHQHKSLNYFESYYDISEKFTNQIFFKAENFQILINSLKAANYSSSSKLVDPVFLHQLEEQITIFNRSSDEKKSKEDQHTKHPQYIWKFRGDFWEISFGYKEPILLRDNASVFYLACLMEQPGVTVDINKLKEDSTTGGKAGYVMDNLQWLRNYKKEIVDIIKEKEDQLELGNHLSSYLQSARWDFSDKVGTSIWDYPEGNDIKLEIFRPKYYFIKEKGKPGLQNKAKNKTDKLNKANNRKS
jgi:hypothetical protein